MKGFNNLSLGSAYPDIAFFHFYRRGVTFKSSSSRRDFIATPSGVSFPSILRPFFGLVWRVVHTFSAECRIITSPLILIIFPSKFHLNISRGKKLYTHEMYFIKAKHYGQMMIFPRAASLKNINLAVESWL